MVAPLVDLRDEFGVALGDGEQDVLDLLLVVVSLGREIERFGDPELLLGVSGSAVAVSVLVGLKIAPYQRSASSNRWLSLNLLAM